MSAHHGNTPAAWMGVAIGMLAFVVGAVALMITPISWTLFWIGVALAVAALVVFAIMAKLGLHD
jgi:hypothetical protein